MRTGSRPVQHRIPGIFVAFRLIEPVIFENQEAFEVDRTGNVRRLRSCSDDSGTKISALVAKRFDGSIGLPFGIFGIAEPTPQLGNGTM